MSANPQGSNPAASTVRPPQLIRSLVGGFNAAANNVVLLTLPALLDLLLWFGPRLSVQKLFGPTMQEMLRFTRQNSQPEMAPLLENFETLWGRFLERFNLLSLLNTFPVGVPSQMAGMMPERNPLGVPPALEITSLGQFALSWLVLTLLGFFLGSLYFAMIASATARGKKTPDAESGDCSSASTPALTAGTLGWQSLQVLLMVLLLLAVVLAVMVPTALVSTVIALISPVVAQFILLMVSFGLVWFAFPLIFSPHGIFACGQSALNAMLNSVRLVRLSLPSTGLFLIMLVVLHQGLGTLWNSAPVVSWLGLAGIFGRAFISTALLAASFFYYRSGLQYQQSLRRATLA